MKSLIAITIIAMTMPAAAMAATPSTSVLRYGDLDLNRPADAALMMRRIDRAALEACGASVNSVRDMRRAVRESACFRETLDRTVSALNAPALTALHQHARSAGR